MMGLAMSRGAWNAVGIGAALAGGALAYMAYALLKAVFRATMAAFEVK